ncbi:EAL domain-containing protein [Bacillus sp. AK128]
MHLTTWLFYKKVVKKWGKLFLPQKLLRFYPPSFTLRDPIVEGVETCHKQGNQAAVIVFNHSNLEELVQTFDIYDLKDYKKKLREAFLQSSRHVFPDGNIISLHNHSNNGHALIVKVEHEKDRFLEIESLMNEIIGMVLAKLSKHYNGTTFLFETGYMFVEKSQLPTRYAIMKACQHANIMAEKKTFSKYNELRFEMNRIIHQKDIRLMAQPIFDVATNETTASEILTRGPKGTDMESPLQLFAVARQLNLLFELENIVLEKAFKQMMKHNRQHSIFINFTPITLSNPRFVKAVSRMLRTYRDVNPFRIIIEITERDSIEDYKHFTENIKRLRQMGFRIAVDDTGAGYSSLHTICEVLPDIIKIDRSVIKDIDTNTVKESMLRGLLLIAKETGSIVVAEGIEKEEEASVLFRNKVDLAQGYFYARPEVLPSMVSTI